MYYVEPMHRCIWDERKGEVIELLEIYGYQALTRDGRVAGEGETREEALTAALESHARLEMAG